MRLLAAKRRWALLLAAMEPAKARDGYENKDARDEDGGKETERMADDAK